MPDLPTTHNLTTPYLRALLREAWMAGEKCGRIKPTRLEQMDLDVDKLIDDLRPPTRYRDRETGDVYMVTYRFTNHDGAEMVTLCALDRSAGGHVTLTELAEQFEEVTHG